VQPLNVEKEKISAHLKGWKVFFFRSCSFAAERLIPGLILAIYAVSVSSDRSSFLARLSPRRGYQVPSSRPAAQRNRIFANRRMQGAKKRN
jgi:hypothetical protein